MTASRVPVSTPFSINNAQTFVRLKPLAEEAGLIGAADLARR